MIHQATSRAKVRKNIIEADLVDYIVVLPGQLFYTTQIPVCLWFLMRNKGERKPRNGLHGFCDRKKPPCPTLVNFCSGNGSCN